MILERAAKDTLTAVEMDVDDDILLDPWILFWQMYRDRELTTC